VKYIPSETYLLALQDMASSDYNPTEEIVDIQKVHSPNMSALLQNTAAGQMTYLAGVHDLHVEKHT
jgi:hypothetical protein